MPLWKNNREPVFKIKTGKNETFLDDIIKKKKLIPSSAHYNMDKDFYINIKDNVVISKSPRVTNIVEVAKRAKRIPGVGAYNIGIPYPIPHGKLMRDKRVSFTDEAMTISKDSPSFYPVNFKHIENRSPSLKWSNPSKAVRKDTELGLEKIDKSIGPQSYDVLEAYKKSQLKDVKSIIDKAKGGSFIEVHLKTHKNIPAPGAYNIEKAQNYITAGANRGWK